MVRVDVVVQRVGAEPARHLLCKHKEEAFILEDPESRKVLYRLQHKVKLRELFQDPDPDSLDLNIDVNNFKWYLRPIIWL